MRKALDDAHKVMCPDVCQILCDPPAHTRLELGWCLKFECSVITDPVVRTAHNG